MRHLISLAALVLLGARPLPQASPAPQATFRQAPVARYTVEIVARHPHDPRAFTQGLLVHDGRFYESTGREGQSDIRRVRIADGKVEARRTIASAQFGEGLALWKDTLTSLTWKDGIAYRWDRTTLKPRGQRRYAGEGWGLTTASDALVLSDGTPSLRFLDPDSFAERRRVAVTLRGRPIDQLNELEMVNGEVFANIWQTDYIVAVDPADGHVTKIIDASALSREVHATDPDAVLNGIAWNGAAKTLYLTGKLWPTVFEVRLVPAR